MSWRLQLTKKICWLRRDCLPLLISSLAIEHLRERFGLHLLQNAGLIVAGVEGRNLNAPGAWADQSRRGLAVADSIAKDRRCR